jgi:isopentenyl phosphate kinase
LRKPLVIVKLGGAAITDKKHIYTPRSAVIQSAARQLAMARKDFSLIIVHGAGSYGHIPVNKYGLKDGFKSASQLMGLCRTKIKLLEWETTLDTILRQNGLPVVPIIPSDFIETRNGRIMTFDLSSVRHWLRLDCVPVIGGDIVPDSSKGFAILSGDQIAVNLATRLKTSKLIFGTDVDGIFDSNPRLSKTATLLKQVHVSSAHRVAGTAKDVVDVTGGMGGKLRESVAAVKHGVPVFFVNLMTPGRLRKIVYGRKTVSSELTL